MNWNPQQQAMLAAMGYTLYRQVDAAAVSAPATAASPAAAAPPAAIAAPGSGERLLRALQQAAGGRDLAGLALPPLPELRASAAAKRALWPRLRALRRS